MSARAGRLSFLWVIPPLAVLAIGGAVALSFWKSAPADPDVVWKRAEADFLAGRWDQAAEAIEQLARLREPTSQDWLLRAQLAMAKERPKEALKALARIPDDDPLGPQARLLTGQLALRDSRLSDAETFLLKAVRLDPKLVQAHRELIYIYGMQSRRKELDEQFQVLARLMPLTFEDLFLWCLPRGSIWDSTELAVDMERFLKADPDDRWSRLALADAYMQIGQYQKAESVLEYFSKDDPDALAAQARLAIDRGDVGLAQKWLAQGPADHTDLNRLRGRLALIRHDPETAEKHYRAAYENDPRHRDTLFGLAQALRLLGKTGEAERFVEAARNLDLLGTLIQQAANSEGKTDPDLPLKIGEACRACGRIPEARCWYRIAISRNPLDPRPQKALYRLDTEDPPEPISSSSGKAAR